MQEREVLTGALITQGRMISLNRFEGSFHNGDVTMVQAVLETDSPKRDLAKLVGFIFGMSINLEDIRSNGFEITDRDQFFANEFGFTILPLAQARLVDQEVEAWIGHTLVSRKYPLAQIAKESNPILLASESPQLSHYLRLKVRDNPGVLARVASEFAQKGVSFRQFLQPEATVGSDSAEMAFVFYPCDYESLQKALEKVGVLDDVLEISSVFRVLLS